MLAILNGAVLVRNCDVKRQTLQRTKCVIAVSVSGTIYPDIQLNPADRPVSIFAQRRFHIGRGLP